MDSYSFMNEVVHDMTVRMALQLEKSIRIYCELSGIPDAPPERMVGALRMMGVSMIERRTHKVPFGAHTFVGISPEDSELNASYDVIVKLKGIPWVTVLPPVVSDDPDNTRWGAAIDKCLDIVASDLDVEYVRVDHAHTHRIMALMVGKAGE